MVVNMEGESRTIRKRGPTFGHKRTLGNICAQKLRLLKTDFKAVLTKF